MRSKELLVGILVWIMSMAFAHGQVQVQDIPDQTIGLGGNFADINLAAYSAGDEVIWEAGFPLPETPDPAPEWSVTGTDYQFEMNVTAVVRSKGSQATGTDHVLAVQDVSGVIRGVASAIEVAGNWVYFLTVYGNAGGTELQYVFYDATYGKQLKGKSFEFNPNAIIGQPDDPFEIKAQVVELSLNADVLSINLTDRSFIGTETIVITALGVDDPDDVYKDTVALTVINDYEPLLQVIPDQVIGFGESFESINLAGYTTLEDGDVVSYRATTGENLTATIDETSSVATVSYTEGWSGAEVVTFTVTDQTDQQFTASRDVSFTVRPEEIAPIVSGLEDQIIGTGGIPASIHLNDFLTTNNPEGIAWSYEVYDPSAVGAPRWQVSPNAFEFSMTMTCEVTSFGRDITAGTGHMLGAFRQSDSALVGMAEAISVGQDWFFFLTVYSNTNEEALFFQFYDARNDKVVPVIETAIFISNDILGDPLDPVALTAGIISPALNEDGRVDFTMNDQSWSGQEQFIFKATDTTTTQSLSGQDTLLIEVIDIQSPTLAAVGEQHIHEGETFGPLNLESILGGITTDQVTFTISGADTLDPVLTNNRVNVIVPDDNYFGSSNLIVKATHNDFDNIFAVTSITYTVENVNDAPIIAGAEPITEIPVGELYRYEINGQDIDDADLELTVTGVPEWLVFAENGGFGLLFGTPTIEDEGSYAISIEVSDGSVAVTKDFTLDVINSYARFTTPTAQVINEGESFEPYDLTTITEKTDDFTVRYAVTGEEELEASVLGNELTVTIPDTDWYGSETLTIQMLDVNKGDALLDETTIDYEVVNVNDAPEILTEVLPGSAINIPYSQAVVIEDIDSELLEYTLTGLPTWLQYAETTSGLLFYGTPVGTDHGMVNINVSVSDGAETVNRDYKFEIADSYALLRDDVVKTINEGANFDDLDLKGITDKTDDFFVTYQVKGGEDLIATIIEAKLMVEIPNDDWFGQEVLTIQMFDADQQDVLLDETSILYEVLNVNDAPEITRSSLPGLKVLENYEELIEVSDIDNEELTYSIAGSPSWLKSVEVEEGLLLYGEPSAEDFGVVIITVEASDGDLSDSQEYSFEVENSFAELTTPSNQQVTEGEEFADFDLTAITDKTDDYTVGYSVGGAIELSTHITGSVLSVSIPHADWYGLETFTISLLDSLNELAVLDQVTIAYEVLNSNDAPVIAPVSLVEATREESYSQAIKVEDVDKDSLSFQIVNGPDWLLYAATPSGVLLYGTPKAEDVGNTNFILRVSDQDTVLTRQFTLRVNNKFIASAEVDAAIQLYPNPAVHQVYWTEEVAIRNVSLYNSAGQLIEKVDGKQGKLFVDYLPSGIYLIHIESQEGIFRKKLLIRH